ncbi:hypothetical protein BX070DRAFT_219048 [Coemansia spiralis]|nr:hypothetical protein BX070DRAFT_219048 [Coemansia spiralis]
MGMTRRRQEITERVPTTPRKVVVYSDNLMTSDAARNTTAVESAKELVSSLADTLNTALVIYTSFRFDPELNMLEILDPYNSRNNIIVKGYKNYVVSVKLFVLSAATDTYNRPSPVYVRQAVASLQKQLGSVKIDELFVSFADISLAAATTDSPCLSSQATTANTVAAAAETADEAKDQQSPPFGPPSASTADLPTTPDSANVSPFNDGSATPSAALLSSADDSSEMARYVKLWRAVNRLKATGEVAKIGLCDLSKSQLEDLCSKSAILPDMLQVHVGRPSDPTTPRNELENEPVFASDNKELLSKELREYAKAHSISVRTHTDSLDMLPEAAFQTLAADFKINERFPTTEVPRHGYKVDLMRPRWVANYSVFLKTRGLVANRGYIVMASSDSVSDPNRTSKPSYQYNNSSP